MWLITEHHISFQINQFSVIYRFPVNIFLATNNKLSPLPPCLEIKQEPFAFSPSKL